MIIDFYLLQNFKKFFNFSLERVSASVGQEF